MMRKLTAREKTLLYIAALLLLFAGGYNWLMAPSDTARFGAETELSVLELEEQQRQLFMKQLPELEKELELERHLAEEQNGDYPLYTSNSILISDMIDYMGPHGLMAESVQVTGESVDQGETFLEEGVREHLVTKKEGTMKEDGKESEEENSGYTIHQAEITVSARGTQEHFYSFLDWAKEKPWIAVTSYSMTSLESQTVATTDSSFSEELRIYMTVSYSMLELMD